MNFNFVSKSRLLVSNATLNRSTRSRWADLVAQFAPSGGCVERAVAVAREWVIAHDVAAGVATRVSTICIDCRYIRERPSGIGEVVQGLVDFIPALAPDLDFVLLRHPSLDRPLSDRANVVERVVRQPANGPATMWWLPQVVDLSGIDLFHAPANIMPARLPVPCLVTVHDVMWLTAPHLCTSRPRGLIDRAFYGHGIRRALRDAAAIATVSAASRDEIVALAPERGDRVHVTLSGVSPEFRPTPMTADMRSRLALPDNRRFVLTVGQNAPYKNHEGAIRAFAAAFSRDAGIDLVLVQRMGRGADALLRLATTLGIADRIHFLPAITRQDLVELYSSAAALLHPSFCEGFGNPLAEAMACGCPVVTSARSAMPEVTAGAARLVDPGDVASIAQGLREVVGDPDRAAMMRKAGLARAAELSWPAFAAANLALYRMLLASI
ncbi:glycosyltransferase family 1 protein [Sphingomonas sp. HF-S3]|uniref:Glycosyltransferase family 1 protein n=1 Tax=Sphingomonas rustica TaxID=3103142 RepID=A0ABV0BCK1_9SPHN